MCVNFTNYKMRKKVQHLLKVNALLRGCFYGSLLISAVFMALCIYLAIDLCTVKESKNEVIELLASDSNPVIELAPLEVDENEF